MPHASFTSPPGSEDWFEAAIAVANRRRWHQLLGASGAALSASLLLLAGPMTHPTATQRVDVVSPPGPSPLPGTVQAGGPPSAVPTPTGTAPAGRPYRFPRPRQEPPAVPPPLQTGPQVRAFTAVERAATAGNCLRLSNWCYEAGAYGQQAPGRSVVFSAMLCSQGLSGNLSFPTSLEVEFVVENTKGQRIDAYSRHYPIRADRHSLSSSPTGICYEWLTSWSGQRADGSRIPGAYVFRIVAQADGLSVREHTGRFDLR